MNQFHLLKSSVNLNRMDLFEISFALIALILIHRTCNHYLGPIEREK